MEHLKAAPYLYQYPPGDPVRQLLFEQLEFNFYDANRNLFTAPFTTGPRQLPHFVLACFRGPWQLRIESKPIQRMEGGAVLIGANVSHEIYAPDRQSFESSWIHGAFSLFGTVDLTVGQTYFVADESPEHRWLENTCWTAAEAMSGKCGQNLEAVATAKGLGFELIRRLSCPLKLEENLANRLAGASRLAPVLEFVERNLAQDIRRDELATLLHLSPTRFHTLFLATMGITPLAHVNSQRMMLARTLLVTTDLPLKGIAERCSPFDIFHFSRVFKTAHGISPGEYRKRHGAGRL